MNKARHHDAHRRAHWLDRGDLGRPHPAGGAGAWGWFRRCRAAHTGTTGLAGAGRPVGTYTLLGVRAADGQPVHLPSSRPAGTRMAWTGPVGEKEEFELTDGVLPDGTYAAEWVAVYRTP
ncbi:hypothetical protein ACFCYH_18200 [Streptomyces sp. NPDC056400]|uniref:hypothetical protein n=1 Tax=Streptomyces sp. NPDC056400 TaxID=3345808 RepID=UPI0035D8E683